MTKSEEWWLLGGVLFLLWVESRRKPGETYYTPMPDWTAPEFEPKEIEILEPKLKPATFAQMQSAYVAAYRNVTGEVPSPHMLAMLLAQSALETGQWKKMYEWNPANITTQGKRGFYRLPGDTTHKYAAYPDAVTGAAAHVALLGRRYPKAMGAMLADAPELVAKLLKEGGFYEAPLGQYAQTLRALFDQFLPLMPGPVT